VSEINRQNSQNLELYNCIRGDGTVLASGEGGKEHYCCKLRIIDGVNFVSTAYWSTGGMGRGWEL